ncbi:MAG: sugar nucleotide-binding protein [Thermoplasmata archaeon]|nr:sugar nucleotide-binding protein [Thermoplasmata archaeon]
MVGSHFVATAPDDWEINTAGRRDPRTLGLKVASFEPLDLSDRAAVSSSLDRSSAELWINFAGRTDVDGCEAERRPAGTSPAALDVSGSAWNVNALFPGWAAARAASSGRFLLHISTDYVFDGTRGPYAEQDQPSGLTPLVSWYGYTKGVGETDAVGYGSKVAVIRIAHPYRSVFPTKVDFARSILQKYAADALPAFYADQTITPTWIPDVTETIQAVLRHNRSGVFHVASPEPTTPYGFAKEIVAAAGLDATRVKPGAFDDGAKVPNRAPRPHWGGLEVSEVDRLHVHPLSFRDGIRTLAEELARGTGAALPRG